MVLIMSKNKMIIFSPKPGATADEVMQILKLLMLQTYPPALRTQDNLFALYSKLPDSAKRHFKIKDAEKFDAET